MIELSTLPPIIQQYIKDAGAVELRLEKGQVIATPKIIGQSIEMNADDNTDEINQAVFDTDRMMMALGNANSIEEVVQNGVEIPSFKTSGELLAWLKSRQNKAEL